MLSIFFYFNGFFFIFTHFVTNIVSFDNWLKKMSKIMTNLG